MKFVDNTLENKTKISEIIKLVTNNMISQRSKKEIDYRPYIRVPFITRTVREHINIKLDEFFGKYCEGDYAYVSVSILSQSYSMASIVFDGAEEIYVNGICYSEQDFSMLRAMKQLCVNLDEGYNEIVFKCVAKRDSFSMKYIVGHVFYPDLWTCDYLYWVRDCIPVDEYKGEQGAAISELIKKGNEKSFEECETVYPKPSSDDSIINLSELYGAETGNYAMSLSYAKCEGELEIIPKGGMKIYINGEFCDSCSVKAGDEICIISERSGDKWGFECKSNDMLHIPFIVSERKNGIHWIHIGSFDDDTPKPVQFKDTYINVCNETTFWRFSDKNTYLRPYLDTSFYGQWFYGLMIGEYGLLRASEIDDKYYSYFEESMCILADYYHYMQYDGKMFGTSTFLKRSVEAEDLDSIGTICMNLYELFIRTKDEDRRARIKSIMQCMADNIYDYIPRMEDGTFYRVDTMWADDSYMSCPFLVRMGRLTNNTKYYDETILQLKNYTQKVFLEEEGVFAHIFWPTLGRNNNVPWGRGNGWVYLSFAEVIEHLPKDYNGRDDLIEIFIKAVSGLVKLQDKNGMWHQVLNIPDSYAETSCTAIFTIAIAKGIKLGILNKEKYMPVIKKAVSGLILSAIDERGNIMGVCRGSGCHDKARYYMEGLETVLNDDHGIGVVVAALCEYRDLID